MTELVAVTYGRADVVVATVAQWEAAVVDWLKNISSDRTRKAYVDAWRDFAAFAGKTNPADVTQSDVIAYRFHLKTAPSPKTGRPYAQSTVNQRLSALSSFFTFAKGRGLRPDNPVDGVDREAVTPYGKATWMSAKRGEDVAFVQAIDPSTDQGKRDRAIMLLYLTGGFRVAEVARLRVGDLRHQGRRLFITYRRKGGEVEEVPVAQEAADALDTYLATRLGLTADSPLFVATDRGRRAAAAIGRYEDDEEKPLSTRAIRYLVDTYATKVFGPGHGIRPHSLRHTAAQAALLEGRSATDVSRLLKHKSMAVTTIYLHATDEGEEETVGALGRRYGNLATA